jgi:hypothetical protein
MDSVCAGGASEVTVTDCVCAASCTSKCKIGAVPESTASFCSCAANPAFSTLTVYSPSGTASKWNSPSAFVFVFWVYSESSAFNTTSTPGIGRCCGSCTIPRTVPNTVANTPAANTSPPASDTNMRLPINLILSIGLLSGKTPQRAHRPA